MESAASSGTTAIGIIGIPSNFPSDSGFTRGITYGWPDSREQNRRDPRSQIQFSREDVGERSHWRIPRIKSEYSTVQDYEKPISTNGIWLDLDCVKDEEFLELNLNIQ